MRRDRPVPLLLRAKGRLLPRWVRRPRLPAAGRRVRRRATLLHHVCAAAAAQRAAAGTGRGDPHRRVLPRRMRRKGGAVRLLWSQRFAHARARTYRHADAGVHHARAQHAQRHREC
eukprot:scaffold34454_cov73-Isochrysis_galbana.AAC.1